MTATLAIRHYRRVTRRRRMRSQVIVAQGYSGGESRLQFSVESDGTSSLCLVLSANGTIQARVYGDPSPVEAVGARVHGLDSIVGFAGAQVSATRMKGRDAVRVLPFVVKGSRYGLFSWLLDEETDGVALELLDAEDHRVGIIDVERAGR